MSHFYDKQGNLVDPWAKGYPSPSTILDIVVNRQRDGLLARMDPEEAEELMRTAADRGNRVHDAIHRMNMGQPNWYTDLQEGDHAYVAGYDVWQASTKAEVLHSELFVYSDKYKFAGRLDAVYLIDGERWIVDYKTGVDSVRHGLQLKFYQQAFFELSGKKCRMGVLALDPSRTCGYRHVRSPYGLKEYREPLAAILAHLQVFKWWNKKQPIKQPKEVPVWNGPTV